MIVDETFLAPRLSAPSHGRMLAGAEYFLNISGHMPFQKCF